MSDEQDSVETPDPTVDKVEAALDKPGDLTVEHLKALEEKLQARIDMLSKDSNKNDEERAALHSKIDSLNEHIDTLIKAQEERDKHHSNETTMVIPKEELDITQNQNPLSDDSTVVEGEKKKKRMGWW